MRPACLLAACLLGPAQQWGGCAQQGGLEDTQMIDIGLPATGQPSGHLLKRLLRAHTAYCLRCVAPCCAVCYAVQGFKTAIEQIWWNRIRTPETIRSLLQLVYARPSAVDDELLERIVAATERPDALDAFTSILLSPRTELTFNEMLERLECPVCLAYGEVNGNICVLICLIAELVPPVCTACLLWGLGGVWGLGQGGHSPVGPFKHVLAFGWADLFPLRTLHSDALLVRTDDCAQSSTYQATPCSLCLPPCCAGRDDPWVVPIWGQRLKRQLPDATYLELAPAGHCPHHEAPTAINNIIQTWVAAVEVGQHQQHDLLQVSRASWAG